MTATDNLDRLPTKFERFLGAAASLLIFLFLGAIAAIGAYLLLRRPAPAPTGIIVVLCGLALLALWAAHMFVKIVRGIPRKPSPLGQLIVGLIATVGGACYLGALAIIAILSSHEIHPSGLAAAILLVSGIAWSRHAWKQLRANEA
jgi:hypothetical protein